MAGMAIAITLLVFGVLFLLLGLVSTFTGGVGVRFSWVYRAEDPKTFWQVVVMYYLGGVGLIGYCLWWWISH
jgi:hypothetical protein